MEEIRSVQWEVETQDSLNKEVIWSWFHREFSARMALHHCPSLLQGDMAYMPWHWSADVGRAHEKVTFLLRPFLKAFNPHTPSSWGSEFYSTEEEFERDTTASTTFHIFGCSFNKYWWNPTYHVLCEDIIMNKAHKNPWLLGVHRLLNKRKRIYRFYSMPGIYFTYSHTFKLKKNVS